MDQRVADTAKKTPRRSRVEGCAYCDKLIAKGQEMAPPHDAANGCESGKRPHCTCDVCF